MMPLVLTQCSSGSKVAVTDVPNGVSTRSVFAVRIRSHSVVLRRSTSR
jgi:hypothetical protein